LKFHNQTDAKVCVPIMDINECRNGHLIHTAATNYDSVTELLDFKKKVTDQIDTIYDDMNICAGSNYKDSCQVRFMLCFQFSGTQA
jgi:hypothetical protein